MASNTYFIRNRGRILGPFDLEGLRKMAQIGTLTRIHEVSADKTNWVAAGSLPSVFAPPPPSVPMAQLIDAAAAPPNTDQPVLVPIEVAPLAAKPGAPLAERFFYSRQGDVYGPMSLAALRTLAMSGALKPDDLVWKEGDPSSMPAAQASAVATFLGSAIPAPRPQAAGPSALSREQAIGRQVNRLALASGFSVAVLLLFCLSVPHGKTADRLTWWWDLLGQSGAALAVMFCFYVLLVALGLAFVTALVRGPARGGVFAGAGVLGLALLALMCVSPSVPALRLAAALLAPAGSIGLVFVAIFRSRAPRGGSGRTVQGILGGLVCLASLVGGALAAWGFWGLWPAGGGPAWMILAVLLAVTGLLCAVACSIIGVAGAVFSRPMLIPVVVLGMAAAVIGAILAMVAGYGLSEMLATQMPGARFVFVQALKLLASAYALAGLMGVGLLELLATGTLGRTGAGAASA